MPDLLIEGSAVCDNLGFTQTRGQIQLIAPGLQLCPLNNQALMQRIPLCVNISDCQTIIQMHFWQDYGHIKRECKTQLAKLRDSWLPLSKINTQNAYAMEAKLMQCILLGGRALVPLHDFLFVMSLLVHKHCPYIDCPYSGEPLQPKWDDCTLT